MGNYRHLSLQERMDIEDQRMQGAGVNVMAAMLGRSASTVSRELRRNGVEGRYSSIMAQAAVNQRRKAVYKPKIERKPELKSFIMKKLSDNWSPVVISGRLKRECGSPQISHESIYSWIYEQQENPELYKRLARRKKQRGMRRCRTETTDVRLPLSSRPAEANERSELGHIESDLMFNDGSQSMNILSTVDRKSRFTVLVKNDSKHASVIACAFEQVKKLLPFEVKTTTVDQGGEFGMHQQFGVPVYFCDPGSPWQKGSIEHLNGMVRRYFPFWIPAQAITEEMLAHVTQKLNNIPRKILGFRTPSEIANQQSRVKTASPAEEAP